MLTHTEFAALVNVLKWNFNIARTQEDEILLFLAEGLKRLLYVKTTMLSQGLQEFEIKLIAAIPALNSARC